MFYRAKCTEVQNIIKELINVNTLHYVKDAKDIYVEVKNEELAELIEKLNDRKLEEIKLINQLIDFLDNV